MTDKLADAEIIRNRLIRLDAIEQLEDDTHEHTQAHYDAMDALKNIISPMPTKDAQELLALMIRCHKASTHNDFPAEETVFIYTALPILQNAISAAEQRGYKRGKEAAITNGCQLPKEPTREIWAAMADAYGKVHRDNGRSPTLHHDAVTEVIYQAIIAASPLPATSKTE